MLVPAMLSAPEQQASALLEQTVQPLPAQSVQEQAAPAVPVWAAAAEGIPDFSRTGYRWSDVPVPVYDAVHILEPPADGGDATKLIQAAIDSVDGKGAVLLRKGIYNISGSISIGKSGVVLRGEGDGTVLVATGKDKRPLIRIGEEQERICSAEKAAISGGYIPAGTFTLELDGRHGFRRGDRVAVTWMPSAGWIEALDMDRIPPRKDGIGIHQWQAEEFVLDWERTVTEVRGRRITLENPLVMPLDPEYGEYYVRAYTYSSRIGESGVENLRAVSEYASDDDEAHSWTAVEVCCAEHCWIRNVNSSYFCFSCVEMKAGAKNITVESCSFADPKARTAGSRKYAFYIRGQQCLVRNCRAEGTRHAYSTANSVCGPNVFLDCTETGGKGDCGPHMRWATGVLYDNVCTDSMLRVQDRGNLGSGQGWAGTGHVFWNCTAGTIVCQSPQVTGKNWCIGCIGKKSHGNFSDRPDGEWISHGKNVAPRSLYQWQLEARRKAGNTAVPAGLINKRKNK